IINRLSDLPDSILHHILSFLDTKSFVQTCILSRRWRYVWKYVDVLTFSKSSFQPNLDLKQSVTKFYPSVVTIVESERLELTSTENRVCICWIG
ncbi:F-box/LRR-repeat protein At3g59200, partial [Linum perenne]